MNLLCLYSADVAAEIIKKVPFDSYHMIVPEDELKFTESNVFRYNHHRFRRGEIFNKKIRWNKIPPLNRDLIDSMTACEAVVLKMIEREKRISAEYEARKDYYLSHLRYWDYFLDTKQIDIFFHLHRF